jgi:hypothetical protein
MKYLYDLNLNNKKQIICHVANLCDVDDYISSGCASKELRDSIIHLLSSIILDTIKHSLYSEKDCNYDDCIIQPFLISDIDIKVLIAILMHFRSVISSIIFNEVERKDILFEYLESNYKYFTELEISIISQWEEIERNQILIK